jgi:hypothetical protein
MAVGPGLVGARVHERGAGRLELLLRHHRRTPEPMTPPPFDVAGGRRRAREPRDMGRGPVSAARRRQPFAVEIAGDLGERASADDLPEDAPVDLHLLRVFTPGLGALVPGPTVRRQPLDLALGRQALPGGERSLEDAAPLLRGHPRLQRVVELAQLGGRVDDMACAIDDDSASVQEHAEDLGALAQVVMPGESVEVPDAHLVEGLRLRKLEEALEVGPDVGGTRDRAHVDALDQGPRAHRL